ncbi:MAG: hypothetical protein PUB87_08230 [Eubacteriaceae bacterium]|nr:hypothetical protein [Eubacteriaceae bacterium]
MLNSICVDAGREGCPCALAESGNCLVCSKLSGGDCNDCRWTGVCIYTLYMQNSRRRVSGRRTSTLKVKRIINYHADFKVFVLDAPYGLCQRAQRAGSFVFAKRPEEKGWFGMPVSVLKADKDSCELHLGIYNCGPKSNNLIAAAECMEIRGIYYSALSGLAGLKSDPSENLIYAKGIAISPLRNILDTALIDETKSRFFLDISKVSLDFIIDYFGDLPAEKVVFRDFLAEGFDEKELSHHDTNVLALVSPYFADRIEEAAGRPCLRPNKGNMCCGEGICGACTSADDLGNTLRRCKMT